MECLSVIPKSTIKPTDITYKIADGKAQQLCSSETPNLHLSSGTEYESDYYVSDWKHMIAYIKTSYEPGMYFEHRVEIYNQLQTGTFPVSVYAGAEALLFAARDLGLPARYRFVGPQYDYEKGYGDVYYHFGSAYCFGHVCTIITIDGKEYIMETQGHEG